MALNFKKWIVKKLGGSITETSVEEIDGCEFFNIMNDIYIRELAFWTCVNKIAKIVSKCEIRTYMGGKPVKKSEYYLWNVEPNKNQNASVFMTKLIGKLFRENKALVVEVNGKLIIADSFKITPFALYDDVFEEVTVGEFKFDRTFYQSEVLYFQLNSVDVKKLVDGIYTSYKELIAYASKAYQKSRGSRGILNIDAQAQAEDDFSEKLEGLMDTYFRKFFSSDNAVLPLYAGYTYDDLGNKTYNNETTRDIKAMTDDIFDFTARAISFPPALAKGDVQDTEKAEKELMTFCIDPLVRMLEKEINRKRNGYDGFLEGNYIKIDTTTVKHVDIFDIATPVDKLISSGALTINNILRLIGEPEIDEDWANQHFITKNYSTIQELLESLNNNTT